MPDRRVAKLWITCAALFLAAVGCSSLLSPDGTGKPYRYDVHLPDGYSRDANARWPLILYLHGAGGLIPPDNLIPGYAAAQDSFPFIIVTPESRQNWSPARLDRLLREVQDMYRVDATRIYVTGVSMGAYGTWYLAATYPRRFAAIALVAGGGVPAQACTLAHLPVWVFHNRVDPVVPVTESQAITAALEACGGNVRLTVYDTVAPGVWTHNAWKAAYNNPELYS